MVNQFSRTEIMFGKDGMSRLFGAKVAVFGIGGVGGFAVEALARSGVGRLDLFDDDEVCLTNINRQIHATRKSIGMFKVDVAKERVLDINPDATVYAHKVFYLPETSAQVDLSLYDYIIDAIDTVSGKIELAVRSSECGVPIISSMSAGNKVDPTAFRVSDIYETSVCPLAKVMRRELRKRGIQRLKVVYSTEVPVAPVDADALSECMASCERKSGVERKIPQRRQIPGSNAFVPPVVGLIIAGEVVKDLITAYPI